MSNETSQLDSTQTDEGLEARVSVAFLLRATRENNRMLAKAISEAIVEYDGGVRERVNERIAEATSGVEAAFAALVVRLESRIARLEAEKLQQDRHDQMAHAARRVSA